MSLSVINLTKEYGTQKAVDNISFEANKGEILGFLGPNGAGKSTTMKIATCFLPPTSGTVKVCGHDVLEAPIKVRELVGYLPEHNPLYLDMYVHEYLSFVASLHNITGKKAKNRVAETVALVGLTKEQNKKIGALSKGYRQRVGLAQALIHDPEVLILDEPTTGLDPNQIVEIRNVIKSISQDKTVIFSTHIMQEVQALCNRVIIIQDGKLVANDAVEQLGNKTEVIIKVEFETACPDIAQLEAIEGIHQVQIVDEQTCLLVGNDLSCRGNIFRKAIANNWVIVGMMQEKTSLETLFKELTSKKK
ncbi:MAG: gliding motility-associated ABC transporter ATP-binding subunit GldA [Flammeovirgaceae bacterium]